MIEVLDPGPLATVQDLGRPGYAELGVGRSGAADQRSHRLANRLVGNAESAATLEATLGGLRLRTDRELLVAVTGAPAPVRFDGRQVAGNAPLPLPAGVVLELGVPPLGLRSYLALRGGVEVAPVLGSRCTDLLSGLGPPALRRGDRLPIGTAMASAPVVEVAPVPPLPVEPTLHIVPGPRQDWFPPAAWRLLCGSAYRVSGAANRIGARLEGPGLQRTSTAELPSEPVVTGALQVPPSGQPVLFLVDHPVTGGYPVIAVVRRADLPLAAQLRPGQRVRFSPG